jgi:hypothetical protein
MVGNLPMVSCQSATVKAQDSEGILPTGLFKQVFISHAGSYAILNPQKRGNLPLEMAALTPLSQSLQSLPKNYPLQIESRRACPELVEGEG